MLLASVFIVVQITVPAVALFEQRPARFGWQMYSGTRTPAAFAVVAHDGSIRDVSASEYLVSPRLEMAMLDWLPQHICEIETAASAVQVTHLRGEVESVRCLR